MNHTAITLDASPSARSVDENGFLHVASSHITKATVNPYYGREIPGWQEAGLDPDAVYYGFRDPDELRASLSTWEGLPLHIEHHVDSADDPRKLTRVGAVGRAVWNPPYIDAPLTVWDRAAIDAIEDGSFRELSCAYRYEPDFTPGRHEGVEYDFVMRAIRGNHVALVEEGRAGPDVVVADAARLGRDAEAWRTTKNGKHYEIDTETGEITKGNIGQKTGDSQAATRTVTITGNELGSYRDIKELRQKAVDYYREHLQGKPAHRDDIGEIHFTRKGMEKSRSFSGNPDKLLMFPALRDIIETGKLGKEEAIDHPRKDGIVAFIPITNTVSLKGKKQEVEVLLGKDGRGNLYYDLFLDARQKKEPLGSDVVTKLRFARDSTGMTPAVDLNIAIRPVRVKPQTGADQTGQSNPFTGALMSGFKKWFRGARDANPDVERQEVDLAQAIIDLHKVDPATGEIVDITEDEDKAAEIRTLVGELSGKLEPEEVKKLTDALADLAYSKATGDADPDKGAATDEGMKKAMDACGLDADDEGHAKAFAEGVKYGEELMRNPAERRKLDREHESEGMKKAMDSCGLDAENPQESRAFAEGVKYGESLERDPAERKKLDREHEAEGMRKAMGKDEDKNAEIGRILDGIPGLTPEQRKKLEDSLQDLAYAPATGDEDPAPAQDAALRSGLARRGRLAGSHSGPRPLLATDAAVIQARAVAAAQDAMRRIAQAVADVRPLVGDLDVLAFDSATDVYGYALEQSGVNPRAYSRQAWHGMVDMLRAQKSGASGFPLGGSRLARDAAPHKLDGAFAGLNTISIAQ